jgi:hypothetical protein
LERWSTFSMRSAIGVPVVTCRPVASSVKTPDRIFTWSGSWRWVVKRDWPGLRRSSSAWISAASRGIMGGHPSMTQPSAGPWLSPKVVTRNRWPNVL